MALTNHPLSEQSLPEWARWHASEPYSIGVEEEVMILDPSDWTLAQETEQVFEELPAWLASHAGAETHAAVIELTTDPHDDMAEAARELSALRADLRDMLRVMDAQSTVARVAALASFVQCIAHLELEQGFQTETLMRAPEILDENRFLAARDGMGARLIDPDRERRVPASEQLADLILAARPHAQQLGSEAMLDVVAEMAEDSGADRQRRVAAERCLGAAAEDLAEAFMA